MPTKLIALCLLAVLSFTGCSNRQTPAQKAAAENILLIGNGEEPSTIDPHLASTLSEAHILFALFEGLVSPDPDDPNKYVPGVASHISTKGNLYQFELRENALWSDGTQVTAEDFVLSAKRALSSKIGAAYPEMFFDIQNAESYYRDEIKSFSQVGIRAISTTQLEIELETSSPNFLNKLKHFAWLPVPTKLIQQIGSIEDRSTDWTPTEKIVSNGPFRLASRRANSLIEVERNPNYWDIRNVALEKIRFFPYEDAQLEHRAFLSGQLHVTDKIPVEQIGNPSDRSTQRSDPFLATSYIIFNVASESLANPQLREALSLAINKESIAADINRSGKAARSFTTPGLSDYVPPRLSEYDPSKSRNLSKKAALSGDFPKELTFVVSNSPSSRAAAEAIQAMWSNALGLEVTLLNMEAKSLFSALNTADFEISYLSWSGDYEDPITFLEIWKSDNSKNRSGWKNAEYDSLLDEASFENDPQQRLKTLAKAEAILLKELPIIPIIWKTKNYNISPMVSNWHPSVLDTRSYKNVSLNQLSNSQK